MIHSMGRKQGELELRPLQQEDIELLRVLRNRNRRFFVYDAEITEEGQKAWFQSYLEKEGDYMFSVFYQARWIGAVALYDLQETCAEFGRLLINGEAAGRGGVGCIVTELVCQIGFSELHLDAITLEVYCDNPAAEISYIKAGFVPESIAEDSNGRKMLKMVRESNNLTNK